MFIFWARLHKSQLALVPMPAQLEPSP
jgi:hypothetical protein